jgi:hypothetical protein
MKAVKFIGYMGAFGALLCMSGYDCPECNFAAQTIALGVSLCVAVTCGIIIAKKED